jgi:hypothetical protein
VVHLKGFLPQYKTRSCFIVDQGNPTTSQSMIVLANDNVYMDNLPNG